MTLCDRSVTFTRLSDCVHPPRDPAPVGPASSSPRNPVPDAGLVVNGQSVSSGRLPKVAEVRK